MLETLPGTLRSLLVSGDADDPALRRLYPSAFLDDEDASTEFDAIVHDDLLEQRLAAIDTMERTMHAEHLTEDELIAWLAALNDLRLVLGVRLAVTEEATAGDFAGDPEAESGLRAVPLPLVPRGARRARPLRLRSGSARPAGRAGVVPGTPG